jgi:hypothetical protein
MKRGTKTPEGYVKHAVIEYLAAERIYCLRANAGAQIIEATATSHRRALQMAPAGTGDLLAMPYRIVDKIHVFQPLWIEIKAPGKKQSPVQRQFEAERIADGHAYIVAYSIDDVAEWLHNFRNFKF